VNTSAAAAASVAKDGVEDRGWVLLGSGPAPLRELAVVTAIMLAVVWAVFPSLVSGARVLAPNGLVSAQTPLPADGYPYPPPPRSAVNDAGSFVWDYEPWGRLVRSSDDAGKLPLWDPYTELGAPLGGNLASAPAGPFQLPLLLDDSQQAWSLMYLFRLVVGGVGCYALLRALRASPAAAFPASLGFLLSPAFVLWLAHASGSIECLSPWLLLAVLSLVRRPRASLFVAVAALTAAACLGGQPEVTVCLAFVAAPWGVYWWLRLGRRWRTLGDLAAAAGSGVLVSAPQLLLGVEFLNQSVGAHLHPLGQSRVGLASAPIYLLGDVSGKTTISTTVALTALAAAGLIARRESGVEGVGFIALAAGVWALRSFSGIPGAEVTNLIPELNRVNVHRYGEFLLVLAACVAAAAGIQAILRRSRRAVVAVTVGVILAAAAWALGGAALAVDGRDALVVATLTAAVSALATLPGRAITATVAIALSAIVLFGCAWLIPNTYARPYDPFAPLPMSTYLRSHLAPGERMTATGGILHPNVGVAMGLPDIRAEDAFFPRRYTDYIYRAMGTPYSHRVSWAQITPRQMGSPLLDALAVRYVVTRRYQRPAGGRFVAVYVSKPRHGSPLIVWRNLNAFPRAWLVGRVVSSAGLQESLRLTRRLRRSLRSIAVIEQPTATMRSASGSGSVTTTSIGWLQDTFRVHARGRAVMVVSDQSYPGWDATIDGRTAPIRTADLTMQSVAVPAGNHTVVLTYDPPALRIGEYLALLGIVVLAGRVGAAAVSWRRVPGKPDGLPTANQMR
jgi:Bacterial membrane protein YfhO